MTKKPRLSDGGSLYPLTIGRRGEILVLSERVARCLDPLSNRGMENILAHSMSGKEGVLARQGVLAHSVTVGRCLDSFSDCGKMSYFSDSGRESVLTNSVTVGRKVSWLIQ